MTRVEHHLDHGGVGVRSGAVGGEGEDQEVRGNLPLHLHRGKRERERGWRRDLL